MKSRADRTGHTPHISRHRQHKPANCPLSSSGRSDTRRRSPTDLDDREYVDELLDKALSCAREGILQHNMRTRAL